MRRAPTRSHHMTEHAQQPTGRADEEPQRPSERITEEVTSWPGVEGGPGSRGEFAFTVGRREIGHLHGGASAHFSFPKSQWTELRDQGRIVRRPVFPGKQGPAAPRLEADADVE